MSQRKTKDLLIVIVNYFMADDCRRLIESILLARPASLLRIICVDNSCDLQQLEALKQLQQLESVQGKSELVVYANTENKGFGAAINAVVTDQLATDTSIAKILLINPDVELQSDSLNRLIKGASSCVDAGIWGGVTVDAAGEPDGFHAWREPTLLRELAWAISVSKILPTNMLVSDYRRSQQAHMNLQHYSVDAISGCFLLIDAHLWKDLKGFDERFFLYSEEIDLCHRARKKGANPQVINDVKFKHARGTSNHDLSRMKMLLNSKLLYWQKHHGLIKKYIVQMIFALAYLVRGVIFSVLPARRKQAKNMLLLSWDLLLDKNLNKQLNKALVDH